jgi:hypothetical protein
VGSTEDGPADGHLGIVTNRTEEDLEVAQIVVLKAVNDLGQHGTVWAMETQDEGAALTGALTELDHLDEQKFQWARHAHGHPEPAADHGLKVGRGQ